MTEANLWVSVTHTQNNNSILFLLITQDRSSLASECTPYDQPIVVMVVLKWLGLISPLPCMYLVTGMAEAVNSRNRILVSRPMNVISLRLVENFKEKTSHRRYSRFSRLWRMLNSESLWNFLGLPSPLLLSQAFCHIWICWPSSLENTLSVTCHQFLFGSLLRLLRPPDCFFSASPWKGAFSSQIQSPVLFLLYAFSWKISYLSMVSPVTYWTQSI